MTPEALPRAEAGNRCVTEPSRTEKLQEPEPMAVSRPRVKIRPQVELTQGVQAVPSANTSKPLTSTPRAP